MTRGFSYPAMSNDDAPRMPYYPWYVIDYRADFKVQRLSWKARALYREILDECWVRGHVPDNLEDLANICRCDLKDVAGHWRHIKPLLREVQNSDGHLMESPRMELERAAVVEKSEQARRAANSRWNKGKDADALHRTSAAMLSKHSISEQNKAGEGASARVENCTCEPTRDIAPSTGRVFLRHAEDCASRRSE